MQTALDILNIIAGIFIAVFTLNLLNKAASYLEQKAEIASNVKLAALISTIDEAITQTVEYVNQTYVDALKASGNFDEEAQTAAYNKAESIIMDLITEDGAGAITEAYRSIQEYLNTKIESTVRELKRKV
jgi:N-methylhydantoinase B/oxoprolinase/acetone carboxylase alpha subunit